MRYILLLLLVCVQVYSQDKNQTRIQETEETIEWLNSKFIEHQFESSDTKQIHTFLEVRYVNNLHYLIGQHTQDTEKGWGFSRLFMIPIEKINNITFLDKQHNVWLEIRMKNNEKAIEYTRSGEEWTAVESFAFMLSKTIDQDNLRPRLLNAFKHLMELYGNKSVEKF